MEVTFGLIDILLLNAYRSSEDYYQCAKHQQQQAKCSLAGCAA